MKSISLGTSKNSRAALYSASSTGSDALFKFKFGAIFSWPGLLLELILLVVGCFNYTCQLFAATVLFYLLFWVGPGAAVFTLMLSSSCFL